MRLVGVRLEMPTNAPIVLMQEIEGSQRRFVPIFIGTNEASAIALALDGVETQRPMTHDLIRDMFKGLGVEVKAVRITDLKGKTFFAELDLMLEGRLIIFSCRPSDALAIAARVEVPIYCSKAVLDEASFIPDTGSALMKDLESGGRTTAVNEETMLDDFRSFLDEVRPEDFDAQ